ncbi:MAG: hypothetical protein HKO81_00365 [Flavobacteriaceae bacterium]|nr:hypothetical protein [Flavobacteriaceae bacterium]
MKFSFNLFLIFILTFQYTYGPVIENSTDDPPQEKNKYFTQTQYDFYSLKHKRQKTTAWILLGAGAALTVKGLVTVDNSNKKLSKSTGWEGLGYVFEGGGGGMIAILGGATAVASIPFFISAGKNKRKASLSIKRESLSFGNLNTKKSQVLSAVVTIDL